MRVQYSEHDTLAEGGRRGGAHYSRIRHLILSEIQFASPHHHAQTTF